MRISVVIAALLSAALSFGATAVNGGALNVGSTPVALSAAMPSPVSSTKVQQVMVRVIPGYGCKKFVGNSSLNTSNYAGTFAVLFPNTAGGWSEDWTLIDARGQDGIDLSTIFVASVYWDGSSCPEQVTVTYLQTGTVAASNLRNFQAGLVASTVGNLTPTLSGQAQTASVLQVRVLPGFTGKVQVLSGQLTELVELYPNSGNPNQSSARSERFVMSTPAYGEQIKPYQMYLKPGVIGEGALVSAWTVL